MDWDQVEELFAEGAPLSERERERILSSAEPAQAAQLRELWRDAAAAEASDFLARGLGSFSVGIRREGQLIAERFRLVTFLGAGGMGEVFSARDERLGRMVALKFITSDSTPSERSRQRLEREARALCTLTHPHVCTLYDFILDGSDPVLVMELLAGETLAQRLERGPLSRETFVPIARQCIEGLAVVHKAGLVHRDLKPANVMLTPVGAKLFDFGIAVAEPVDGAHASSATTTQPAEVMGSAPYMSPEHIAGRPTDARSDIFAVGCLLYELVTGRRAFARESPLATIGAVLEGEPTPISSLASDIPPRWEAVIARCLRKNPGDRYQRATDVLDDLDSPESDVKQTANTAPPASGSFWPRRLGLTAVAAATALVAVLLVVAYRAFNSAGQPETYSLVVLPFERVDNDSQLEYVADGISESVTNVLSRSRDLRVIARSRAFAYRGRGVGLLDVARTLDVRGVVTGRVSRAGSKLRIQAELVDARSGTQVWGDQFEGDEDNLLAIQTALSQNLGRQVNAGFSPNGQRVGSTSDPRAYVLYLKGRQALGRSTVPEIQRSIDLFQQALAVDPTYGLAYAGLADSYIGLSSIYLAPNDAMKKAKAAVLRAIEIDPDLPEAQTSIGVIYALFDFDWPQAQRALERAIALRPDESAAHLWHAWVLVIRGQAEAGLAEAHRALELDPLSSYTETGLAQMYWVVGQRDTAVQRLRSVVQSAPDFFNGYYALGVAHLQTGDFSAAVLALEQARRLDPKQPQPLGYLSYAYARAGQASQARDSREALEQMRRDRYVSGYLSAVAAVGAGKEEEALDWLERAFADHDDMLSIVKWDQVFASLRPQPRMRTLLGRLGLE